MFEKIEIERFRGIRYASVEGFRLVNLFFGKNNCGKSSMLEAIFLATGMSNLLLPVYVNLLRGYRKSSYEDLKLDFYNLEASQPIHIRLANSECRNLHISLFKENKDNVSIHTDEAQMLSNVEDVEYGFNFEFGFDGEEFESRLILNSTHDGEATRVEDGNYKENLRCNYLGPKYDFNASIKGLKNIIENKDEHFIVEGLRLLDPRVRDFVYTDGLMLVDIGLEKRMPVNVMGDGARKIVALLTGIYDCKDGVLLIDEISNGFHYSVMKGLWTVLIDAAIRNNTQLFATTHDMDSIRGLRDTAVGIYDDNVASFKLLKTSDDELKALHYSLDSLNYSINQDIEVR